MQIAGAAVAFRSSLFRDCVCALLKEAGVQAVTLALSELGPESAEQVETLIVEDLSSGTDWRRIVEMMANREQGPDRLLILTVSLPEDEIRVIASRRIKGASASQLTGLLGAWHGAAVS